jgi:hypothetical protein
MRLIFPRHRRSSAGGGRLPSTCFWVIQELPYGFVKF